MGSKILLADDSITIQKVVNLTFADEGIDVVTVSNGEMAERRLAEINPDLVLADIFMPGRNGYELCQYVKESPQFKNTPVVLLVGAFEPFDQAEAKRVKADAHLTKPFESRTLVDTVRKLIQSSKAKSGPLRQPSAPLKQTRQLDEQPAPAPLSSFEGFGAPAESQLTVPQGYAFPTETEAPAPAQPQAEPFSVGFNQDWQAAESSVEQGAPDFPSLSFDLGTAADIAPTPAAPPAPVMPEFNPSTLSADTESESGEQGFSFSVVEPAQSQAEPLAFVPASVSQPEKEQAAEEPVLEIPPPEETTESHTGFAVPSLFGQTPQEDVIAFNVVDEQPSQAAEPPPPIPPSVTAQESAPAAFEVDFGDTLPLPPTPEELSASQAEQAASSVPSEELNTVAQSWPQAQENSPFSLSFNPEPASSFEASGFDAVKQPEAEAEVIQVPGYLGEDEPLGDVFTEEATAEAVEPTPAHEEESQVAFAVSDSEESGYSVDFSGIRTETAEGEAQQVFVPGGRTAPQTSRATGELDESSPATPPSIVSVGATEEGETGFAFAEPEKKAVSFQPLSVEPDQPVEAPVTNAVTVTEPESSLPEQFTSSGMWATDAAFSPIDIEASPVILAGEPAVKSESPSEPVADFPHETEGAPLEPAPPAADESGFAIVQSATAKTEPVPAVHYPGTNGDAPVATPATGSLPADAINEIVKRVLAELSDSVVREIAWEVVPECVERVVERLSRESLSKRVS